MNEDSKIEFKLGELTGQVASLLEAVKNIDNRLQRNEKETTRLGVKMGIIGIAAGAIGSFGMSVALKFIN